MPKPISNDERAKVIRHKQNGESNCRIARWFFISESAVSQIWKTFQVSGECNLRYENCGRKSSVSSVQECEIFAEYEKNPDTTYLEMIDLLGLKITESGLSRWLKKRGFSF
jgi:transposase